ncbi:MAG: DegT/DnrJ/EryC1/StrS family aminotransferase [Candidatus Poribacteria bacterium]
MISHSRPWLTEEDAQAAHECVMSGWVKEGVRTRALEATIATHYGAAGALATTGARHAIHLALRSWFPDGGARVGVPTYVCRGVYDAVAMASCCPALLDISPTDFTIDVDGFLRAHARDPFAAVIVPDMFGIRAPIERFTSIPGVKVLQDSAMRVVAEETARSEGAPDAMVLSFEATKPVVAGEGGMLVSCDGDLIESARGVRDGSYSSPRTAWHVPLTDLQASLVASQWQRIPEMIRLRRRVQQHYAEQVQRVRGARIVQSVCDASFPYRFLLRVHDVARFIDLAEEQDVVIRRPIAPHPLHYLFHADGGFAQADNAFGTLVSAPVYPDLRSEELEQVGSVLRRCLDADIAYGRVAGS